jgi:hypothetical protein
MGDSLQIVVLIGRVFCKKIVCLQNRSWGEVVRPGRGGGCCAKKGALWLCSKTPKKSHSYGTQSFYFVSWLIRSLASCNWIKLSPSNWKIMCLGPHLTYSHHHPQKKEKKRKKKGHSNFNNLQNCLPILPMSAHPNGEPKNKSSAWVLLFGKPTNKLHSFDNFCMPPEDACTQIQNFRM